MFLEEDEKKEDTSLLPPRTKNKFSRSEKMLSVKADFKHLMNHGEKISLKSLIACYQSGHGRLGIIVSKKVSKKATERNRIRRLVKEAYRLNQDKFLHTDILVIGRKKNQNLTFNHCEKEILLLADQISC